jgi:membrane-associated PAP2 superfamily phosphatase
MPAQQKTRLGLNQIAGSPFYAQQAFGLLVSACFLMWIYPAIGLDQLLITPYFDVTAHQFLLKNQVFLAQFMHLGLKYCMMVIALASLLAALQATVYAASRASFFSRVVLLIKNPYFLAFVGMVVSTSVVAIFKSMSIHGCPNDLSVYGGNLPLLKLFDDLPVGVKAGHCFPGGHASGGFALMAFYFAFRDSNRKFAEVALALALVLGFAMGWAQMMRGEHFLSHNLWSAWLVWLVLFLLFVIRKLVEKN